MGLIFDNDGIAMDEGTNQLIDSNALFIVSLPPYFRTPSRNEVKNGFIRPAASKEWITEYAQKLKNCKLRGLKPLYL